MRLLNALKSSVLKHFHLVRKILLHQSEMSIPSYVRHLRRALRNFVKHEIVSRGTDSRIPIVSANQTDSPPLDANWWPNQVPSSQSGLSSGHSRAGQIRERAIFRPESAGMFLPNASVIWSHAYANKVVGAHRKLNQSLRRPQLEVVELNHVPIIPLNHWDPMNWYHFLFDLVPKIWQAELGSFVGIGMALGSDVYSSPNHRLVLDAVVGQGQLLPLDPSKTFACSDWLDSEPLSFHLGSNCDQPMGLHYRGKMLRDYQAWLNRTLLLKFSSTAKRSSASPQKLFLARPATSRRSHNQRDLTARLDQYGFVEVETGELRAVEQARLLRDAKVVVAPSGAALANLIFAQPGTRVVVYGTAGSRMWERLGTELGLRVQVVELPLPDLGANSPGFSLSEMSLGRIMDAALSD